MLCKSTR